MVSLARPDVGAAEVEAVTGLIDEGRLSTGEVVADFERDLAGLLDADDAAAVCSGSVALELALDHALESGDAVAVSPYNCGAVLYSLLRTGLEPVFVDVDPATYNVDPAAVETVAPAVDGLLMVHMFGQPCDVDALLALADDHDLTVIDNVAQAPGATHRGEPVGTCGDVGVCSFGATKNLTTAEGGAVVGSEAVADAVRTVRSNAGGDVDGVRRSVRMNDLEAAIGVEQIQSYDDVVERKRKVAARYRDELPDDVVPTVRGDRSHVYHGFPLDVDDRDALHRHLADRDVESAAVYEPLHRYGPAPAPERELPRAERAADRVLLLPIHARLTDDDVATVVEAVLDGL